MVTRLSGFLKMQRNLHQHVKVSHHMHTLTSFMKLRMICRRSTQRSMSMFGIFIQCRISDTFPVVLQKLRLKPC